MLASRSLARFGGALRPAVLSRTLRTTAPALADEAASAGAMTFSLNVPTKSVYSDAPVSMVIVPGGDGVFGVMPDHVPTIAELKPGIVSVQETEGGDLTKYFISGGFMSMTSESKLTVTALEALSVEDLDPEAVKTGLAQYAAAYASATEDVAKAEAEIGVEVYQAMSYAINDP